MPERTQTVTDREEWVKTHAYYLWVFRNAVGIEADPTRDWLDAEEMWEHLKRFEALGSKEDSN